MRYEKQWGPRSLPNTNRWTPSHFLQEMGSMLGENEQKKLQKWGRQTQKKVLNQNQ